MLNPYNDPDTAEIRIFRSVVELNHRILHTASLEERTALRSTVETLRGELVKLIENMPIASEEDVRRAHTARSGPPGLIPRPYNSGS